MDPLSLLRDYTVRNEVESIQQVGNEIEFGEDYKFPCNMETAYRSKQGSLYTLEALVFFVKNTHLKHTLYMQQARSLKLQIITFTDRKPLLDYLEGKVSTTDAIELLAPAVGALPSSRDERERLARLNQDDETGEFHGLNDVGSGPAKRLWSTVDDWEADLDGKYLDSSRLIDLIRERERPIRDRETILLCPNKSFQGILAMLSKRDEEKKKTEEQQRKEQEKSSEPSMPPPNSSNRFAKVEEKRFWRDHLGTDAEELGIDPTQSYIEDAAKQKEAAPSKPRPADLRRPYNHTPQRFVSSSPSSSISKAKPEGVPIILVPNALQTLMNTYNAKEFLEDGIYVAPDVKAKINGKKPEVIHIQRKMGRPVPVKYEVRDKATSLSSKDWERVVAVFVLGKEWQFKDWPFKDHVDILNKILGVYLRFEDDSMESVKVVKQWNVKIISLSKHKRHQDRTAVLEFWDKVDAFIRARKLNIVF